MPDRRAGEAGDYVDAQLRGRLRGVLHPVRGAPPHGLRLAVARDRGVEDAAVAIVEAVLLEPAPLAGGIPGERAHDVDVVAGAGA